MPAKIKRLHLLSLSVVIVVQMLTLEIGIIYAENIDPSNSNSQYAYGENVGWFNGELNDIVGIQVQDRKLTGYIWVENIGWVILNPANYGGVMNDGRGHLSGYAWGENVGWINFNPAHGGVLIDPDTGVFSGYAWGENVGWISFNSIHHSLTTSWQKFPWILFIPHTGADRD